MQLLHTATVDPLKLCLTLETPWTVTRQASLSMGVPRQEHWSGLLFPPPGDLPAPGMEPEERVKGRGTSGSLLCPPVRSVSLQAGHQSEREDSFEKLDCLSIIKNDKEVTESKLLPRTPYIVKKFQYLGLEIGRQIKRVDVLPQS